MNDDALALWRAVEHTDPSATKKIGEGAGALSGMTAINVLDPVRKATALFGPLGSGWRFEIVTERYDDGAPIFGEGGAVLCMEKHHTILIRVTAEWQGKTIATEQYGTTPYVYSSKYGPKSDGEAPKKSLSDALKKALTLWGFNADIHMGQFDDPDYFRERQEDEAIARADDQEAERARLAAEHEEHKAKTLPLVRSATQVSELEGLCNPALRRDTATPSTCAR